MSFKVILEEFYVHWCWGYYHFEAFLGLLEEVIKDTDDNIYVYGSLMGLIQYQTWVVW